MLKPEPHDGLWRRSLWEAVRPWGLVVDKGGQGLMTPIYPMRTQRAEVSADRGGAPPGPAGPRLPSLWSGGGGRRGARSNVTPDTKVSSLLALSGSLPAWREGAALVG